MIGDKFEILVKVWNEQRKYRLQVEIIHKSDQVIRCKLTAGEKEMVMEKHLLKKTNKWKVPSVNFTFKKDDKTTAMAIMYIQDELDYQLKERY